MTRTEGRDERFARFREELAERTQRQRDKKRAAWAAVARKNWLTKHPRQKPASTNLPTEQNRSRCRAYYARHKKQNERAALGLIAMEQYREPEPSAYELEMSSISKIAILSTSVDRRAVSKMGRMV